MSLRISGGRHRGRVLQVPEGQAIRPTAARVREAAFDILLHGRPATVRPLRGARVLDAYAGTGALGLEALSRGADHVTFIERDRTALTLLRANVERLGEGARVDIVAGDAARPPRPPRSVDIVLLDPPYAAGAAETALMALAVAGWIGTGTVAMAEGASGDPFVPPPGFRLLDERTYGRAAIRFLVRD